MDAMKAIALAQAAGGGVAVESLSATENGTYTAPTGKAYSPVAVNVPQTAVEAITITENGTVTAPSGKAYNPITVDVSCGGASVPEKAVNFRDYDGRIVYAYSAAEFAALEAMPANPDHTADGLTAQGWNWTLAEAKAYVASCGGLEIGQMYITTDGKTRVHIHLEKGRTRPMLGVCPNGSVDVDWGDGTEHDTLTGTSTSTAKFTPAHNYAAPGDYVIKLTVSDGGSFGFYGSNSTNQYAGLLRFSASGDVRNYVYRNAINSVFVGAGVTSIRNYAFYYCYNLTSITMPRGITSIGTYGFFGCMSLASITLPSGMTSIESYGFSGCSGLKAAMIPNSVTSIVSNAFANGRVIRNVMIPGNVTSIESAIFQSCDSLTCLTIPSGVASIKGNAFFNCYSLAEMHFKPTAPPTVIASNAFSGIPADCVIYVPSGCLSTYMSAQNYPTSATYAYVEE